MPKPGSKGHGKSGHLSDRLGKKAPRRYLTFTEYDKQVGLAVWLESWLSHLGVAGLSPGHDNLWKPLGEYAALVRLCMMGGTKTGKFL